MSVIIDGTTGITTPAATVSGLTTATGGVVVGAGAAPAFSAYQSGAQTLSSTLAKIQFQTEEFDTANCFDSTTNYRFTPNVAGYYQVYGSIQAGSSATTIQPFIYKNGSAYKSGVLTNSPSAFQTVNIGAIMYLNGSTDYIELYGTSSTTQALVSGATNGTYFSAAMVRSA